MEIILIILTGAIIAACLLYAFKLGYDLGKKSDRDGLTVSDQNRKMLQEYANFVSYVGDERGE